MKGHKLFSTLAAACILCVLWAVLSINLAPQAQPAPTPIPVGAPNTAWTPIEQVVNDIAMVYVPSGCFMMGSTDGKENEAPVHEACMEAFWIGKHEVTNLEYHRFVEAGGYARRELWTEAGWAWRIANNIIGPKIYQGFTAPNQPRIGISWYEAYAYAQWRGARLPTEAEWEYAARGSEGLRYPWGNAFEGGRLNFCDKNCQFEWADKGTDDDYRFSAPVGAFPHGMAWVGALDMSGNVREWMNSHSAPYPYTSDAQREAVEGTAPRMIRGNSWFDRQDIAHSTWRAPLSPDNRDSFVGLRVVISEPVQ